MTSTSSALQAIGNGVKLALCCKCGTQRTFKRMRNRVYWDHEGWTRDTGDLKCGTCRETTRHAAIDGSDHAERFQLRALGFAGGYSEDERRRIQDRYRQGLPRNPYLKHVWLITDQEKALKCNTRLRVHCGDLIDPPALAKTKRTPHDDYLRPSTDRDEDIEYEDPSTGLWWRKEDCTNCLRVSNALALESRRKHLTTLMTTALAELLDTTQKKVYDQHIEGLIRQLEAVYSDSNPQ